MAFDIALRKWQAKLNKFGCRNEDDILFYELIAYPIHILARAVEDGCYLANSVCARPQLRQCKGVSQFAASESLKQPVVQTAVERSAHAWDDRVRNGLSYAIAFLRRPNGRAIFLNEIWVPIDLMHDRLQGGGVDRNAALFKGYAQRVRCLVRR